LFQVPQLHGKQDDVHRPDLRRIVRQRYVAQVHIAERAFDLESVFPYCIPMLAASKEEDVVPRGCKAGTEVTANGTRSHDRDTHRIAPLSIDTRIAHTLRMRVYKFRLVYALAQSHHCTRWSLSYSC
jgi:hypothetical protein